MTDPSPPNPSHLETGKSLWQRCIDRIRPRPNSSEALHQVFADAEDNQVIGAESRIMLEGVLRMAELTAGKVMVAAARTDLINIDATLDETMHQVIDTAHSRFPVFEGERDNIIGILLAKDLLKLQRAPALNIRTLLRPPVFIPESKGLNDLLRDFRNTRNHMALVVDEFGRVAGLITIEDVLEQIVGDIEDEFDEQDDAGDIYALVDGSFRVSGDTAIERVEEAFETTIFTPGEAEPQENRFDTIGGFIAHAMGHVPRRGELFEINGLRFQVLLTKAGAVKWFKVFAVQAKTANTPSQTDKAL